MDGVVRPSAFFWSDSVSRPVPPPPPPRVGGGKSCAVIACDSTGYRGAAPHPGWRGYVDVITLFPFSQSLTSLTPGIGMAVAKWGGVWK